MWHTQSSPLRSMLKMRSRVRSENARNMTSTRLAVLMAGIFVYANIGRGVRSVKRPAAGLMETSKISDDCRRADQNATRRVQADRPELATRVPGFAQPLPASRRHKRAHRGVPRPRPTSGHLLRDRLLS